MATSDESNDGTVGSSDGSADATTGETVITPGEYGEPSGETAIAQGETAIAQGEPSESNGETAVASGEPSGTTVGSNGTARGSAADGARDQLAAAAPGDGPDDADGGGHGDHGDDDRSRDPDGLLRRGLRWPLAALGVFGSTVAATANASVRVASRPQAGSPRRVALDECVAEVWDAARTAGGGLALCGSAPATDAGRTVWVATLPAADGRATATSVPFDGFAVARSIAAIDDGGVVVVGSASPRTDATASDALALRVDPDGRVRSRTILDAPGYAFATAAARTRDGGCLIGGGTVPDGATGMRMWVAKTDDALEPEWTETYARSDGDAVNAVVEAADGGYLLVGSTAGGRNDAWLVKVDGRGRREWDRTVGGDGYDVASAAVETRAGGYAIAGHTTDGGDARLWLAALDASGEREWKLTYPIGGRSIAHDLVETDGGFALAGSASDADGRPRAVVATVDRDGSWRRRRHFDTTEARAIVADPETGRHAIAGTDRRAIAGTDRRAIVGRGRRAIDGQSHRASRGRAVPWIATVAPEAGVPGSDGRAATDRASTDGTAE